VSEANESQTSYSVEQADIFQYQSYSHSDDMFIILRSNINTDTSIFVFSRKISHDSKDCWIFPLMVIFIGVFFITNIKVAIHRFCLPMPFRFRKHKGHLMT
jgi:hypothetical protein